ncbi:MAG: nuclear transport factor 2 family protein, partial [Pseudomonadota bacterium]
DTLDLVSKASAYVAASNARDVRAIEPMLHKDCRYISTGVGEYTGRTEILSMMTGFFASNPDVHWTVADYILEPERCVVFEFVVSLAGQHSNGTERIWFSEDGVITCIKVDR